MVLRALAAPGMGGYLCLETVAAARMPSRAHLSIVLLPLLFGLVAALRGGGLDGRR